MILRPCGLCRALVPGDTGCGHWKPRRAEANRVRRQEKRRQNREAVDEFHRMIGVK